VRIVELYRRLQAEVAATVATGNYPDAQSGEVGPVRYLRLGARAPYPLSRLTYAACAHRLLRAAAYDAAVFDFSVYTPLFIPRRRPVGITVHHLLPERASGGKVWGWLQRAMLRRARWVSATSAHTQAQLLSLLPPETSVHRVGAGVKDALFDLPRREQDYVLYFGRMDVHHKGLDTLLAAFAEVAAAHPRLLLKLAGRGRGGREVLALAQRLGLERRVQLLGEVSESAQRELLSGALVQLMPSRFEGFGLAAAEAMAAGVPLLASSAGALPEVTGDGARRVPPGDAKALAQALHELLSDEGARERLSRAGRDAASAFRWDAVAKNHLTFLRAIAAERVSA
jgi:glycosyltransferase involved in cell wall biosynthesis